MPILELIFRNAKKMLYDPKRNTRYLEYLHLLLRLCDHSAVRNHLTSLKYSDESFQTIFHLFAALVQGYIRERRSF